MTIDEMIDRKNELGYSCEKLSELSGVPLGTVQKIFSRITKRPRQSTISALENILRKRTVRYDDLMQTDYPMMVCEKNAAYGKKGSGSEGDNGSGPVKSLSEDVASGIWSRQGTYTVDDYLALPDDIRVELIDGVFYDMSAPSAVHQIISMQLSVEFNLIIRKNKGGCTVFAAPFDIQLDKDDKTMVQPDILVICKRSGFTFERGIGAPDLVIEILSPSTKNKDMRLKLRKYEAAGVREYWIINPETRVVIVYDFEAENLTGMYTFSDKVPIGIWEGKSVIDFSLIASELDRHKEELT